MSTHALRQQLIQYGQADAAKAFQLTGWRGDLSKSLLLPSARFFARTVLAFERAMDQGGPPLAAESLLAHFAESLEVIGAIPVAGPVVIAANHPGMMDAMAVWKAAARPDLLTIAAQRDLLDLLPATKKRLILIDPESPGLALRQALTHLRQGGALLTFPAGRIEVDPDLRAGALDSLASWSASPSALAAKVPGCRLIAAAVSGVISPRALRNPFVKRLRTQADRDWAAATLQIVLPSVRRTPIRLWMQETATDELTKAMRELLSGRERKVAGKA